jgi:DNA-binding response OmpR family regulator
MPPASDEFYVGTLRVDLLGRRVFIEGEERVLTRKEFDVLLALASPPGRAVSYDELYVTVWRSLAPYSYRHTRVVSLTLCRLRRKLGPGHIVTLWGYGARLCVD